MEIGVREIVYLITLIVIVAVGWNLVRTTNVQYRKRLEQSQKLMKAAQEQSDGHAAAMLTELRAIRKVLEDRNN